MANVTLMGASFSDVPAVTLPQTGGGTVTFTDVSPTTAVDEDVTSGKIYFKADGSQSTGTGSGGGGGGLVYETGTYTPTENVAQPTINFADNHSTRPFYVTIFDVDESTKAPSSSVIYYSITSWYDYDGTAIKHMSSSKCYARTIYFYINGGTASSSGFTINSLTGTTNQSMPFYLTTSSFSPYFGGTDRYLSSGRTYKWIAVWSPTT